MSTTTSFVGLAGPTRPRALGREFVTFGLIGIASTLAYVGLYAVIRSVAAAGVANALALVITAVGNTAANRRLTFGVRGRRSVVRDQLAGLAALGVALALTSGAIALLGSVAPAADRTAEIVVLVAANALATAVRFLLLRGLIAAPHRFEGSPS